MKLTIWEYKGKEYEKTKELDMCERATGERTVPKDAIGRSGLGFEVGNLNIRAVYYLPNEIRIYAAN